MDTKKQSEPVRQRRKVAPPPMEAYDNRQLDLFRNFLANTAEGRDALSNAIALWDSIPRYAMSRMRMNKLRTKDGLLKLQKVPFTYEGNEFVAQIQAAVFEAEDGKTTSYYPSAREELIEHALRKIAVEQQAGFFDQPGYRSGVRFSLWQLRQELIEQGHELRYDELMEGLEILASSSIKIIVGKKDVVGEVAVEHFAISPYLSALAGVKRADYEADRSKRWTAQFHPLVTHSIDQVTYRQFNYRRLMKCSSQLARWLLAQLVLKYTFAAIQAPFKVYFSTIKRDSALLDGYGRQRDAIAALDAAWNELKNQGTLMIVKKDEQRGSRNRLEDVIYMLTPSINFVAEQKASNKRLKDDAAKLKGLPGPSGQGE